MIRNVAITAFLAVSAVALLTAGCGKKETTVSREKVEDKMAQTEPQDTDKLAQTEPQDTGKPAKRVKLDTSLGSIVIELNEQAAPVTVANFLSYVQEGSYDGTVFHRVIRNFMIQGGGFTPDMQRKQTRPPIVNEASNGLKNDRGTIAMARTSDPHSATSQFFINHKDNQFLNYAGQTKPGYTVFGKVVKGMDVVDKIAQVPTTILRGLRDVPAEPVVIKSARIVSDK